MRASWITVVVPVVMLGCSAERVPNVEERHDPERARVALTSALDAWKRGQAGLLARRNPPIRFVDDDFAAGWKLADYEIEEPDAPLGPHTNVAVILSLKDKRGKAVRRESHYQVSTEPGLAVLRSDP